MTTTRLLSRSAVARLAAAVFSLSAALPVFAHGSLANGRMLQVRVAGPSGHTPAAWNDSYYTWNQNSRNFPDYASPTFSYSTYLPNGAIANAGTNDGTNGSLNFSGLNTPSLGWTATSATAGSTFPMRWLATAPHDPSYFDLWMTTQGYDAATQPLNWPQLQYLGRWSIGDATRPVTTTTAPSPVDGASMIAYDWSVPVPTNRSGRQVLLAIWQRVDPAGEAFVSVQDVNVVPEPAGPTMLLLGAASAVTRRRR